MKRQKAKLNDLKKGENILGLAGIILSAVCMFIGFVLGFLAVVNYESVAGVIGFLLFQ